MSKVVGHAKILFVYVIWTLFFVFRLVMTISQVESFVKKYFKENNFDVSHDFNHVLRVKKLANEIAKSEIDKGNKVDLQVVEIAALMHDVGDFKYQKEGFYTSY
jgi:HD superfamily phosphodiesterase